MKRAPYSSIALLLLLLASNVTSAEQVFVLDKFLREYVDLNAGQIDSVHRGKAVAIVLQSPIPDEVFVFGTVHIEASPESYLQFANDLDTLRKLPSYLAVQKFSNPPHLSDLHEFTIDAEDLKELKSCKPGDCQVQLPSEAIDRFQKSINWMATDVASQANELAQQMALQALLAYQKGGNAALGVYRDKNHPTQVAETFQALLSRLKSLPVYLPDLNRILLEYPGLDPANSHSEFYWEKVDFGLKPTLRIVQQITYRGGSPANPTCAVALKQLYANHYFQSALDLTVCMKDAARPNERGFYLITVKASQQAGLTGLKGGILRKVAVGKSRSSLERTLTAIKERLEATPVQGDSGAVQSLNRFISVPLQNGRQHPPCQEVHSSDTMTLHNEENFRLLVALPLLSLASDMRLAATSKRLDFDLDNEQLLRRRGMLSKAGGKVISWTD